MSIHRIDKILSHEGFGSRKSVKCLLNSGKVSVNGISIYDYAFKVNPDKDVICVDDNALKIKKNIYIMMNKISGTVSANTDCFHKTVFDILSPEYKTEYLCKNIHIAGRLDIDTEGLILLTTDGALIRHIISPKSNLKKSYFVRLKNNETCIQQKKISELFFKGIYIESEGNAPAAECKSAEIDWQTENECILTITEGKYHQVKRMFAAVKNEVIYLKRISIGKLKLDSSLLPGGFRELTDDEIKLIIE